MKIVDRDFVILNSITKFRFLLGRQIRILANFSGQRACDRRLKILMDAGYIKRKHYIYGIPGLYFTTKKAKEVFALDYITSSIRIEQIVHEIAVVDTAIYLMRKKELTLKQFTTEREQKHKLGFGKPTHSPDLLFDNNCVEVELTLKNTTKLEKNVKRNFIEFDWQYWVVEDSHSKLVNCLQEYQKRYPNMKIINLKEVQTFVKTL